MNPKQTLTRDKGQGTRDKGQGTRDKGQGTTEHHDDEHIGAVEGDRPTDCPNQGNPNGSGVDAEGLPNNPVATAQDEIGANLDETEGG